MQSSPSIAVYDLLTYFSRQPTDIRCCPVCGSLLSRSAIAPSKAALDAIAKGQSLISAHNFTRLYTCEACPWWAVWESWGYYEYNGQADYLIVPEGTDSAADQAGRQASPWNEVLTSASVYDAAEPLPDILGELFVGGERIDLKFRESREIPKESLFARAIARMARMRWKRK